MGKTFFAELVARVVYGETFDAHLIGVNCRVYAAGRFPPVPPAALAARPLAIVALDGAEVLPGIPPVATLWADAVRSGRAAFPATGPQGQPLQQELHFGRCLIVATANLGREQVAHVGFRPGAATEVDAAVATRLIRDALAERFADGPGEFFPADRWLVLPPLQREDLRRLVDLELATLAELLPVGSPPVEISGAAADRLIALALAARSSNKSVALVELLRRAVEPPVDAVLLRQAAPVPLQVRIDVDGEGVGAEVVPAPARRAGPETA